MPGLIPVDAWNAAVPLETLRAEPMPVEGFYTRSNFGVPDVDAGSWQLTVGGLVEAPRAFSLDELRGLGESTEVVTMECAGNGRTLMQPVPKGTPWDLGAVSVGEFTGVPLRRVLEHVRPDAGATEFVFTGADQGRVEPEGTINYAFNLEAQAALADGPLLAWGMNGRPLTPEHGAPLRLLVPNNYGMSSVKWLTTINAVDEPFTGHFRLRYRYFEDPSAPEKSPVGPMRVRSLITRPEDGATSGGEAEVAGVAWSGHGRIVSVAVRIDDGEWLETKRGSPTGKFAPTPWSAQVTLEPGAHVIAARASDDAGHTQPLAPVWNRNGFGNNVVHRIRVTVG